MNKKLYFNQSGIAQVVVLLLLLSGVALGTYLVRERTNLIPHAQEGNSCQVDSDCVDLPQYCDGDITRQCGGGYCDNGACQRACEIVEGNPLSCGGSTPNSGNNPPDQSGTSSCSILNSNWTSCNTDQANNGYVVNNDGYMKGDSCHRKIYKYEETLESGELCCSTPFTPAADQAECKANVVGTVDGDQLKTNGSENQTNSCKDNGLEYCEEGKKIVKKNGRPNNSGLCDYDFEDLGQVTECSRKDNGTVIKEGQGISSQGEPLACEESEQVNTYYDTKVLTNLAYYTAITKGTPELCVKADLGQFPHLYAHSQDDPDNERRLFMCSGKDGSIKWRVVSQDGNSLVPTQEEFSIDVNQEQVQKAKTGS